MASTACDSGMPEPSRRPCSCGSDRATPASEDALAGPCPAQAIRRVSSPFRNRCARTPAVARPLGGYSANAVTFPAPGAVPGKAPSVPDTVTTTAASSPGATVPKNSTWSPAASLIPAMPPAVRPCGRTFAALKRSSWACLVRNTRSTSSAPAGSTPTTVSLSLRAMTSQSSRLRG
ncbi:hypothetical protein D9M69_571530 [compost metagenome]